MDMEFKAMNPKDPKGRYSTVTLPGWMVNGESSEPNKASDDVLARLREIKTRFAYKGKLCHSGDCLTYACGICNCGLIHALMPYLYYNETLELYPDARAEWLHYKEQRELLQEAQRKTYGRLQGRLPDGDSK